MKIARWRKEHENDPKVKKMDKELSEVNFSDPESYKVKIEKVPVKDVIHDPSYNKILEAKKQKQKIEKYKLASTGWPKVWDLGSGEIPTIKKKDDGIDWDF